MVRMIGHTIRLILLGIRLSLPWVWRGAILIVTTMLISSASLWRGVPRTTHDIAEDICERAYRAGFPTLYLSHLYWTIRVMATTAIAIGWLSLAYFTVFVTAAVL